MESDIDALVEMAFEAETSPFYFSYLGAAIDTELATYFESAQGNGYALLEPKIEEDDRMHTVGSNTYAQPAKSQGGILKVLEPDTPCIDPRLTFSPTLLPAKKEEAKEDQIKMEDDSGPTLQIPYTIQEVKSSSEEHSLKKRRVFLDAVEITTPQWLLPHLNRVKTQTKELQEQKFLNPKFKIKIKDAMNEGLGSVFRRVDALSIKPFPLPPHIENDHELLDFTVSREFTSAMYGGNMQETFPKLSKRNQARHPYRDFAYINLTYNPYAPQRPGHPGLFYRSFVEVVPRELRVLIRVKDGAWLYLGQYELILSSPLTKEEWIAKSDKTKDTWCTKISLTKWGKDMRVRIALRKSLGREPTAQEIEAGDGAGVSAQDVRHALDSGVEVISVSVMKCVGYDEAFQRELRDKSSTRENEGATGKEKSRVVKAAPDGDTKTRQAAVRKGKGKAAGVSQAGGEGNTLDTAGKSKNVVLREGSNLMIKGPSEKKTTIERKRKRRDLESLGPGIIDLTGDTDTAEAPIPMTNPPLADVAHITERLPPRTRRLPLRYRAE